MYRRTITYDCHRVVCVRARRGHGSTRDDRRRAAQVRARHRREEVVLDLVVESAHHDVENGVPRMLRLMSTCRRRKSSFRPFGTSGIPLWFGAKDMPM